MRKLFRFKLYFAWIRKCLFLPIFIFLLGWFVFITPDLDAQVFSGDANLTTQAQVDAFNFTSVTGNLTLFGSAISNLDGLANLQSIGGTLEITNTFLTKIDGLSNLTSVGNSLLVRGNSALSDLNGFSGLTSVARGLYFLGNSSLVDFDGLLSLSGTVEGIRIAACPIVNLHGFSSVFDVSGFIELLDNPHLVSLEGLEGLQPAGVVESIQINNNPVLQNTDGLLSIKRAGGIQIIGNQTLPDIHGLSNLESLGSMIVDNNPALTNINGLSKIQTTTGSLFIRGNHALENIDGLSGLTEVGRELILSIVPNVDGLNKLTKVGTNLFISINPDLIDLDGLQNLIEVGNDLHITLNIHLVDFCGLTKLFTSGTIGGIVDIANNGANTVTFTPSDITVNADEGLCSAVVSTSTIGNPIDGCLVPIASAHSDFPPGNIFPVGTTNITWTATDGAGNTASGVQHVTVVDNQPPVITTCPSDMAVSCASDVPDADISLVTATDNCPEVTITHVGDAITNQTCANRFTLTRTYQATDHAGNTAQCSQVITVNDNVPPEIAGLSPSESALWPPNHTMRDITLNYTATDNCVSNVTTSVTVTSNEPVNGTADGDTDPDWIVVDCHHIKLRAERAANGTGRIYTITVTVSDGCNAPVSVSTQVIVVHNITGPASGKPFIVGSNVNFSGEFWDKPTNTHTAKWLIDGNTAVKGIITEPATNKNGKATGSYKFTNAGVYKLQMNITDQTGLTSYANTNGDLEEIIVIYDPNGGYAYGGGWFNSPTGAFKSNPSVTGKVSYGFAINYFKGATLPKGETQFEFKLGDFEYNAVNFDYLAISGAKAQFKGTGKIIGGQSGVNFIMTVIDGDLDGTGIDKVRMKIYNKNTGQVYYDNQPGASDAADPTTAVGVNSSVVVQNTLNTITQRSMDNKEVTANELGVTAIPNPSNNNFTLTIRSNDMTDKIMMQVVDLYGRIIETRNVTAEQTIKLGDKYRPGAYFIKFIQGENHKQLRLVKLPN